MANTKHCGIAREFWCWSSFAKVKCHWKQRCVPKFYPVILWNCYVEMGKWEQGALTTAWWERHSSLRISPNIANRFRSWGWPVPNSYKEGTLRIHICQLNKTIVLTTWHPISFGTKVGALIEWLATSWLQWSKIDGKPVAGATGGGETPGKIFAPRK